MTAMQKTCGAAAMIAALAFALGALLGSVGTAMWRAHRAEHTAERDTVTVARIDTIAIAEPRLTQSLVIDPMLVRLPVRHHFPDTAKMVDTTAAAEHIADAGKMIADSAWVEIPMQTKTYTDSATYRAVVSGAWATLDAIEVYPRTVTHTVTVTATPKQRRWAVTAGVGMGITPHGIQPMLGVSVGYRLW